MLFIIKGHSRVLFVIFFRRNISVFNFSESISTSLYNFSRFLIIYTAAVSYSMFKHDYFPFAIAVSPIDFDINPSGDPNQTEYIEDNFYHCTTVYKFLCIHQENAPHSPYQ